jgi:hypothetical protein
VAFENLIGAAFPTPYREFLKQHNGGFVREPNSFRYMDRDLVSWSGVRRFHSIADNDDRYSLSKNWRTWKTRLPERIIPIADDGIGSEICISVSGADVGKIYYMEHEIPHENEKNLFLIADDFTSFIEGLIDYPEDEE